MYGLDGPEPPHRSQTSMLLHGDWGGPWLICTLRAGFVGLHIHAGACGLKKVPKLENQLYVVVFQH